MRAPAFNANNKQPRLHATSLARGRLAPGCRPGCREMRTKRALDEHKDTKGSNIQVVGRLTEAELTEYDRPPLHMNHAWMTKP